jgi:hypothetical protein
MGVRINYLNIHDMMLSDIHGMHPKDMFVCHETVSPDIPGWQDILNNAAYLDTTLDYGIHGLTDLEGKMAWAYNLGDAIFYQCGGVNTRSVGVEQVSPIPSLLAQGHITIDQAKKMWYGRSKQLHATAQLMAGWHNVSPKAHPLNFSDGTKPGVTTHWNVSQHFSESLGHTDCHPAHLGGYYPVLEVIEFAQTYVKLGYHF